MQFSSKQNDSGVFSGMTPDVFEEIMTQDVDMVSRLDAVDMKTPLVPAGNAAPKGLSQIEHVEWAELQKHEFEDDDNTHFDEDLKAAVDSECNRDPGEIAKVRERAMDDILWWMLQLDEQRRLVQQSIDPKIAAVTKMIHIPLISMMISQTSLSESEKSLPEDLMTGMPMVGDMRDCEYQGKHETKVKRHISREEAVEKKW